MGLDTRYQLPVLDDCHGMLTIPCHQVGMNQESNSGLPGGQQILLLRGRLVGIQHLGNYQRGVNAGNTNCVLKS